jgi:hypothetical protein
MQRARSRATAFLAPISAELRERKTPNTELENETRIYGRVAARRSRHCQIISPPHIHICALKFSYSCNLCARRGVVVSNVGQTGAGKAHTLSARLPSNSTRKITQLRNCATEWKIASVCTPQQPSFLSPAHLWLYSRTTFHIFALFCIFTRLKFYIIIFKILIYFH